MQTLTLKIPGPPVADTRPRFAIRGKGQKAHVHVYDQRADQKKRVSAILKSQIDSELLSGALSAAIFFFMPRPMAHYGSGRNSSILRPSAPKNHIKKPDLDNLIKFVKDCCNKTIWHDDSQVIRLVAEKLYRDPPMTLINITYGKG